MFVCVWVRVCVCVFYVLSFSKMMASIDFDAVLNHLGAEGRYQTVLYYLICIPATIPAAFLAFNQVFLSATPAHWCRVPQLEAANWTLAQRKAVSIPFVQGKYDECSMYNLNYTAVAGWFQERGGGEELHRLWLEVNNASTGPCQYGWEYDKTDYEATLVTEVSASTIS